MQEKYRTKKMRAFIGYLFFERKNNSSYFCVFFFLSAEDVHLKKKYFEK